MEIINSNTTKNCTLHLLYMNMNIYVYVHIYIFFEIYIVTLKTPYLIIPINKD